MEQPHYPIVFRSGADLQPDEMRDRLKALFPEHQVAARTRFLLLAKFAKQAGRSQKATTIRYSPKTVEYPASTVLPIFDADNSTDAGKGILDPLGSAKVLAVAYKPFGCLNDKDARSDGFHDLHELRQVLFGLYGNIRDDEVVSIFRIVVTPEERTSYLER